MKKLVPIPSVSLKRLIKDDSARGDAMKTMTTEKWAVLQKAVRSGWVQLVEYVYDSCTAITNGIAGGSIALAERCSASAMVRDE